MTKLHCQTTETIKLKDAIQQFSRYTDKTIGLLYSPQNCYFIKLNNGEIELLNNDPKFKMELVFEARIFNEEAELRWLNKKNGEGKAVLITENELYLCLERKIESLEILATQDQTYLLWGESTKKTLKAGWSQLATSRIGSLYIPLECVNNRACLKTREYLQEDCYGNVSVVEERLIELEPVS